MTTNSQIIGVCRPSIERYLERKQIADADAVRCIVEGWLIQKLGAALASENRKGFTSAKLKTKKDGAEVGAVYYTEDELTARLIKISKALDALAKLGAQATKVILTDTDWAMWLSDAVGNAMEKVEISKDNKAQAKAEADAKAKAEETALG